MVDPKFCVSYIWSTLKYKISVGEVVGHAYPNEDSKSKYLYVNDTIDGSIYRFVRTSDHNINILKTLAHKKQPWLYDNVNIEFRDKIRINNKGNFKFNDSKVIEFEKPIRQNKEGTIQPFDIYSYLYDCSILFEEDAPQICKTVFHYIKTGSFIDKLPKEKSPYTIIRHIVPTKNPKPTNDDFFPETSITESWNTLYDICYNESYRRRLLRDMLLFE